MSRTGAVPRQHGTGSQGALLGIVLDLSESMRESIRNETDEGYSKLEALSGTFHDVIDDAKLLLQESAEQQIALRLFIQGFGFQTEYPSEPENESSDIFAGLINLEAGVIYYQPLQQMIEHVWFVEMQQIIEQHRIRGNAREEMRIFFEDEADLRVKYKLQHSYQARVQRSSENLCQKFFSFEKRLRMKTSAFIVFAPLIICCLWIIRQPFKLLAYVSKHMGERLEDNMKDLRTNAADHAARYAGKVGDFARHLLNTHKVEIQHIINTKMTAFLDQEAFKFIRSYHKNILEDNIRQAFDIHALKKMYVEASQIIGHTLISKTNMAWLKTRSLLRSAEKDLKIKLDWQLLQQKTLQCARQTIWEELLPRIRTNAQTLARERFTRALLITLLRGVHHKRKTLSLREIAQLLNSQKSADIAAIKQVIFGRSPLGTALKLAFTRMQNERNLPQNKGLHPALIIITDGLPTDAKLVDIESLVETIKAEGISIVSCFITNKDVARPWTLRSRAGWFWPTEARKMFAMASSVDEWSLFGRGLEQSRFIVKRGAKLFVQVNHTENLRGLCEAILLPVDREKKQIARSRLLLHVKS